MRPTILPLVLLLAGCADLVPASPDSRQGEERDGSDALPATDATPPDGQPPGPDAVPDAAPDATVPVCDPGVTSGEPCPQDGVCAGSTATCTPAGTWGPCTHPATWEADEARCDGLDNDCDGRVDEAYPDVGHPCDGDDADQCLRGRWTCATNGQGVVCSGDLPMSEVCNGTDDDCDGQTDESLVGPPAAHQSGVCAGLAQVCGGAAGWQEPDYAQVANYEPREMSCDGRDNDCDGRVDAGLFPPDADRQMGVCANALKVCAGASGWLEPDYTQIPGYEDEEVTCDGLDNDCDGLTDETFEVPACRLSVGVCAAPVSGPSCQGVDGVADCDYGALYQRDERDTCDGLDNDCDGHVDEGRPCPIERQAALIPAGDYTQGSPADEAGRDPDETPHHSILTRPFLARRTEVTQGEWQQLLGDNPAALTGADQPVEQVSWLDAVRFLNAMSTRDGLPQCYRFDGADAQWIPDCLGWRLPTEAEWEYMARGGTATPVWTDAAGLPLTAAAWFRDDADGTHHPIAQLQANGFGLYDVLGNVDEWVWDFYAPYPDHEVTDYAGPDMGTDRISRGGAFRYLARLLRSANRTAHGVETRSDTIGLRPVRSLPPGLMP